MIIIKECWNYRKNYGKEERIRLEERFKILVQESRNRHDACINRLRLRYIEFLEEQRTRDERNHKLLEALDRVDNSLALMTAKTDRLNVLRKQYETYLHRIYTAHNSPGNIDDKNNASHIEDTYLKRDVTVQQNHLSPEIKAISSLQIFRLNGQTNRSISPTSAKLTKTLQNSYYDHCERNIEYSKGSNQQISDNQNTLRPYPLISQNSELIQQLPTQNLTSQYFQQGQQHVQVDPSLHVVRVSLGRSTPLNKHTISHLKFNTLLSESTETFTNGSTPQNKFLCVPQHHFSPITQPFRQENDKISLDDTQPLVNVTEVSPVCRTMPVIIERNISDTTLSNKSLHLSQRASPNFFNYPWKKTNYFKSKQRSASDTSVRSLTTSEVDNIIRRYSRFTPKTINSTRLSIGMGQNAVNEDKCKTTTIVENELDSYIAKIRKLHHDLDTQSLEEANQQHNTSTVILNASSSNDDLDFSIKEQSKDNFPKGVEKILALADDLVSGSRTVDIDVAKDSGKRAKDSGRVDEDRNLQLVQTVQSDTQMLERNRVEFSRTHGKHETSAALEKDKISNDIKLHEVKLVTHENIEEHGKETLSSIGDTLRQHEWVLPKLQEHEMDDIVISSNDAIIEQTAKNVISEDILRSEYNEKNNVYLATESNVDRYSFDIVEELEPLNLNILQKRIKKVDLADETANQTNEKRLLINAVKIDQSNTNQTESLNKIETVDIKQGVGEDTNVNNARDGLEEISSECLEQQGSDKNETEISEVSELQHLPAEYEDKSHMNNQNAIRNTEAAEDQVDKQNKFNNKQKEECDETNFVPDTEQNNEGNEYNNQNYYEQSDQPQDYAQSYETEYIGLNEEYNYDENYDQNVMYDTVNQEESYDPNVGYENDQNVICENDQNQDCQEYINQEYVQESGEQYGEYTSEQYGSENQYEHDPNVQYQEDPNQQYAYNYDEQYDPNQVSDIYVNQSFVYTDCTPNDSQLNPEEGKSNEDKSNEERKELKEKLKDQEAEGEKVDMIQGKSEELFSGNELKKKKDVIKSLLDSDTDSTIERNVSNTESDFDFN
ncbi:unnamed protein product [Xylocopa violacea]|uniref:Uncharacterized protein n=1 Tax=Xylocopa violacea TaxID=135666 RepID=A0ABP1P6F9_XYLVO